MTDFRKALLSEYYRLCLAEAKSRVTIASAEQEITKSNERRTRLEPAIKSYDGEQDAEVNAFIISFFIRGWPSDFIAEPVSDISGTQWTVADVESRAAELHLQRPPGWTSEQAQIDFKKAMQEECDEAWVEAVFGLPSDAPPEPLALPAPEPRPPPEPRPRPEPHQRRMTQALAAQFTPERIALIQRDYPTYRVTDDLLDELHRMPGTPISTQQLLNFTSTVLHIHRPKDYQTKTRQMRGELTAGWCTPARRELLKRDYPNAMEWWVIRRNLMEHEGPPLPKNSVIRSYCQSVLMLTRRQK